MIRRAPAVAAIAAAVLAALAIASCAPAPSAHAQAGQASYTAQLVARSRLLSVAPATNPAPPPVDLALYRLCRNPKTYAGSSYSPVASYVAGYADAGKLDGALRLGFPSLALVRSEGSHEGFVQNSAVVFHGHDILCSLVTLQLDYHGQRELPPFTATLLGFRFAPVTATAILSQPAGSPPLTTVVYQDQGLASSTGDINAPFTTVTVAQLQLQLTNVQVNGVPLNVGPSCRTQGIVYTPANPEAPGDLVLTGGTNVGDPTPSFGTVLAGGTVAAEADIPPFTGCVTPSGENLDPLLTASVSGPGNYVRTTIGPLCPYAPIVCKPPSDELPLPQDAPIWNVTNGGSYTAGGALTLTGENPVTPVVIKCSQSDISGIFPDESGPIRGGLATVQWTQISGCTGPRHSTWKVAQQGTGYFGPDIFGELGPRDASGNIDDMEVTLTETAPSACQVFMAGYQAADYNDAGSVLTLDPGTNLHIFSSTCPNIPADNASNPNGDFNMSAVYPLKPGGMIVSKP
jgi:hypothetical protein